MEAKRKPSEAEVSRGLVERIVDNDKSAESEMVQRYHRGLVTMLSNRSKDRSLAEDIAHETWILVIQKVRTGQLRDNRKLAAYIVQIGKNQLIMHYRKSGRHQHVSDNEVLDLADKSPTPEEQLRNEQLGQTVDELFDGMSTERDADILRRFYLIGDNKQDLCKAHNLSEAHFDRVLFRARQRFKKLWASKQMGDRA